MNVQDFQILIDKELEDVLKREKPDLLIIDSIASPYQDISQAKKRATEIKNAMKKLKNLTQKYSLTTLVTTHIYRKYSSSIKGEVMKAIGGEGINFYSDYKMKLTKNEDKNVIIVEDLIRQESKIFVIEKGLLKVQEQIIKKEEEKHDL